MGTLLLRHADHLVTMDDQRREIADGAVLIEDQRIIAAGPSAELPDSADEVIDCRGMLLLPGLVNTHHHLYQTLTRAMPGAQDAELFGWLKTLYPIWSRLRGEDIYISAKLGLTELLLSGCTTSSDHLYIYPNDARIDDEIRAAQELGIRFHAARGSMSVGESQGGLPPDSVVEDEQAILRDTRRVIEQYHDAAPYAMLQVVVAPCSPFSVSQNLMREAAALARSYGVRLHTHLAENANDVTYSMARFGQTPGDYAESVGWVGADVWHAHCVKLDDRAIELFGRTQTGICHCPSSNMRLASGIAPLGAMLRAQVPLGLGVDGSASNDSSHLLAEARMAMLLQRVGGDPAALSARQALELATRGGAQVLGRDDIGSLAVGKAADIVGWSLDRLAYAGALHDPVAALVFCQPQNVDLAIVNGQQRVRNGEVVGLDLPALVAAHNARARALVA
jgi:cytosine/adenosine deaminase-related metal-dependent hydrolase